MQCNSQVIGPEKATKRATSDGVHSSGLEVNKDGSRNILARRGLVVVDVDAFKLGVGGTLVRAIGLNAVLLGDDFPMGELIRAEIRNKKERTRTWHRSGYHTDRFEGERSLALNGP